jgi:folate-dependent tRNA-U54 methylase TrmFO/GidA
MNANFGVLPPIGSRIKGREKKQIMADRALQDLDMWLRDVGEAADFVLAEGT